MSSSEHNEGIVINGGVFRADTVAVGRQARISIQGDPDSKSRPEYDVALSFANEDRLFVREVAEHLKEAGVYVFYDEFESTNMWGENLLQYLHEVFRYRAKYCVPFLSEAYSRRFWTNYEKKSAQSRAEKEEMGYVLPVRMDNVDISDLSPFIRYIDGRISSSREIADIIKDKVGIK